MAQIQIPLQYMANNSGASLENGYLYIGVTNLNPITNPISVYWDSGLTQLAAQPLRTSDGYVRRNGAPARIYISQDICSMAVTDKNGLLLWSMPDATSTYLPSSTITQTATGHFYTSDGARINRLNDRLFVAAATVNDGNVWSSTPGASGNQDYVSQNIPQGPSTAVAQFASLSTIGGIGGLFGTRTSDGTGSQAQGELAVTGIAINDYTTTPVIAEGAYFEAQRKPNAGTTTAVEMDSVNQGAAVIWNPYKSLFSAATGYTFGLSIAAGGTRAGTTDSSAAISILNNGANFGKGIVFYTASLDSNNEAVVLARNHKLQWYNGTNQNFATAASATIGSNQIDFTATSVVPYVGMVITPSDGVATWVANTYVTVVDSATRVHVSTNAIKTSAGLTIAGLVGFPTNTVTSTSTNTNQDAINFTDTGILMGSSPATNGGLNCAGVLKLLPVANGANYLTAQATAGGTPPSLATSSAALSITSATGQVFIGNSLVAPTVNITTNNVTVCASSAIPAGGTQNLGLQFSTTSNFGVFFGSGAPTLVAAKGSLYLRTDGSTTNDRMYVNTNGATTWTAVTTVA